MTEASHPVVALVAVLAGVFIVRHHLWRAVLCLAPQTLRTLVEEPGDAMTVPGTLEGVWDSLRALGFTPVGSHTEAPRFGRAILFYDAALPAQHTWTSVAWVDAQVRVLLLTRTSQGFVLTTNYPRVARELPGRYLAGALVGASPDRLLKAHLRRVAELGATLDQPFTLEGRVELTRAWLQGPGATELRLQHAIGLLWALGGLALIASVFVAPRLG
jgi:hypothetical protein